MVNAFDLACAFAQKQGMSRSTDFKTRVIYFLFRKVNAATHMASTPVFNVGCMTGAK
jgi:hypothetical protein